MILNYNKPSRLTKQYALYIKSTISFPPPKCLHVYDFILSSSHSNGQIQWTQVVMYVGHHFIKNYMNQR